MENKKNLTCSELVYSELADIKEDVKYLRVNQEQFNVRLITAIEKLPDKQTFEVLTVKIGSVLDAWAKAVPLKLVFAIFTLVVILVFGLVFGIEATKDIFGGNIAIAGP